MLMCGKNLRESNAKAPDGFGFKAVGLIHAAPELKVDGGTLLVPVLLESHQDITIQVVETMVAVKVGDWLANGNGDNDESNEDEGIKSGHDEETQLSLRPVEGYADEGIECANRCLDGC